MANKKIRTLRFNIICLLIFSYLYICITPNCPIHLYLQMKHALAPYNKTILLQISTKFKISFSWRILMDFLCCVFLVNLIYFIFSSLTTFSPQNFYTFLLNVLLGNNFNIKILLLASVLLLWISNVLLCKSIIGIFLLFCVRTHTYLYPHFLQYNAIKVYTVTSYWTYYTGQGGRERTTIDKLISNSFLSPAIVG